MWRALARRASPAISAALQKPHPSLQATPTTITKCLHAQHPPLCHAYPGLCYSTRAGGDHRVVPEDVSSPPPPTEQPIPAPFSSLSDYGPTEDEEVIERVPLPPGISGDKFGLYEIRNTAKDWRAIQGSDAILAVHGPEELWAPAVPNEGAAGGRFAVVMAGGTQHKVMIGDVLYTNRMEGEVNEEIVLDNILVVGAYDWSVFGRPLIAGASVVGIVEEQTLSGRVIVAKFKKRKGYRRRMGHRQPITRVRICDIRFDFPEEGGIVPHEVPFDPKRPPMPNHVRFW